jgi:hypothetical protein
MDINHLWMSQTATERLGLTACCCDSTPSMYVRPELCTKLLVCDHRVCNDRQVPLQHFSASRRLLSTNAPATKRPRCMHPTDRRRHGTLPGHPRHPSGCGNRRLPWPFSRKPVRAGPPSFADIMSYDTHQASGCMSRSNGGVIGP